MGEIETLNIETENLEELKREVERLRRQNKELKRALLSSLDARIYSLLGLCGFTKPEECVDDPEEE